MLGKIQGTPLLREQIADQCLAIVYSLIHIDHHKMQKELLLVLYERLELMAMQSE